MPDQEQVPPPTEVPSHAQRRIRPDQNPFRMIRRGGIDPDDRIDRRQLGVSDANRSAKRPLQGREAERHITIVAQNQLH